MKENFIKICFNVLYKIYKNNNPNLTDKELLDSWGSTDINATYIASGTYYYTFSLK